MLERSVKNMLGFILQKVCVNMIFLNLALIRLHYY